MTKTNKKGTSLVELLAVIVIMGIIAAIAVPTVGALLKNTRQKGAASDFTTMYQAAQTYLVGSKDNTVSSGALLAGDYVSIDDDAVTGTIIFTQQSNGITVTVDGDVTYKKDNKTYKITYDTNKKEFKAEEQ